jgi:hypothetical protein
MLGHWRELGALYLKYIPDDVRPQVTEAVSGLLGREASEMSYEHELQADEFAYRSIERMGYPAEAALSVFMHLPMQPDTPTHPGTRKRVAHLRSLQ